MFYALSPTFDSKNSFSLVSLPCMPCQYKTQNTRMCRIRKILPKIPSLGCYITPTWLDCVCADNCTREKSSPTHSTMPGHTHCKTANQRKDEGSQRSSDQQQRFVGECEEQFLLLCMQVKHMRSIFFCDLWVFALICNFLMIKMLAKELVHKNVIVISIKYLYWKEFSHKINFRRSKTNKELIKYTKRQSSTTKRAQ